MKKIILGVIILIGVITLIGANPSQAGPKEYTIPTFCDFSGPLADFQKIFGPTREAVFGWWNDREGKKLGIILKLKKYDTRYDATQVASMWPGIVTELKPILVLGLGGADLAAIQQRLPNDKVPAIYGPPGYGFGWLPNQWFFQPRATFVHEWMTALRIFIEDHPDKRPVRVATMSTQASPAFIDWINGIKHYISNVLKPQGLATLVASEWVDLNPVDVSSQIKNIIDKKADVILGPGTTMQNIAAIKALELYKTKIPFISSPHIAFPVVAAMKSYEPLNGWYLAAGHISVTEKDTGAYKMFQVLQKDYGVKGDWNALNMIGIIQSLLSVRAIEHAAKMFGSQNLTGESLYKVLSEGTFSKDELMGILPTLKFTKSAPFPSIELKVKVEKIENGKIILARPDWVPVTGNISKW